MTRGQRLWLGWALSVGIAVGAGLCAPGAWAATFVVDTASGSPAAGHFTLGSAITAANTAGGANTIEFKSGLGTVTLAAAGLPAITDAGLTVDGCAPAATAAGGCQQIDATAASSADVTAVFDVQASGVALQGLKVDDAGGDNSLWVVQDETTGDHLSLLDDTLTAPTTGSFPAIDAVGNDLVVGGLDATTHLPDHAVTITCAVAGIELDGGDDDLIAGNSVTTSGNDALEVDDPLTGLRVEANSFGGPNGGIGIVLNQGVLTDVGDPNLQAPPNTFSGFSTEVQVTDPGSAQFFDNTNQLSSNPAAFYDLESGADAGLSPPAITSARTASVSGTAGAGNTVELLDAGPGPAGASDLLKGVVGTTVADSGGHWTITPTRALTAGSYVSALQTNAGNGSSANAPAVILTQSAPAVATSAATALTSTTATLNGTVNPMGGATTYYFEYKPSGAGTYAKQPASPASAGSGTTPVAVTAGLTGLAPNTTYVYHLVGSNTGATVTSSPDTQFVTPAQQWTVTGSANPPAGGSVAATSPSTGSSCSGSSCTVDAGGEVDLTATAASGYEFTGWTGACAGAGAACKLGSISADQSATASFTANPVISRYTVSGTASPTGGGSVAASSSSAGASCAGASCSVDSGGSVQLRATPASGYSFSGWSGACSGTADPCTVTKVTADQRASASFNANPVIGKQVVASTVKGSVSVRVPHTTKFVALGQAKTLPVGSIVNATNGSVALTSAKPKHGVTQTADFYDGEFKITQNAHSSTGLTNLTLTGPGETCGRAATEARHKPRSLWGNGKGNFRTTGQYGSATVRGTEWFTEDLCNGTEFHVVHGVVAIDAFKLHKTITLRTGHSYLAPAKKPVPKR